MKDGYLYDPCGSFWVCNWLCCFCWINWRIILSQTQAPRKIQAAFRYFKALLGNRTEEKKMNVRHNMPKVQPIPIPTKGLPWYKRMFKAFNRRQWRLIEDYVLYLPMLGRKLLIPAPFDFDFASVPRIFWWILDPVGVLLVGSLPHDFGYKYGGLLLWDADVKRWTFVVMSRSKLDRLFEDINRMVNDMSILARLARYAVNAGGWSVWNKYRKEDRRVFIDYPDLNVKTARKDTAWL